MVNFLNNNMDYLANIANIASLLGLLITLYILLSIWKIKKSYIAKARLPLLLNNLNHQISNISNFLGSVDNNEKNISIEIERCISTIKNIQPKLNRGYKKDCMNIIKQLEFENKTDDDKLWEIYSKLAGYAEVIKNYIDDLKWS